MSLVERMAEMMAEDEHRAYCHDTGMYNSRARRWLGALLKDESLPDDVHEWLDDELRTHLMGASPANRI